MLNEIYKMFSDVLGSEWVTDMTQWSDRIALCREYIEGDHRQEITSEMAQMLRLDQTDVLDHFNANYMQKIVDAMCDRLIVDRMALADAPTTGDGDAGQEWVDALLRTNRWDELQNDVHESVVGDGDTFVMAVWDEAMATTKLVHELAYDGEWGMIPIYARRDRKNLHAAVKVVGHKDDEYLVYVYRPDRVETYLATSEHGGLHPYVPASEDGMTMVRQGDDGGELAAHIQANPAQVIPVVHYVNRRNKRTGLGMSEIIAGIPLNDVINRTIMSMVAASELSAFQIPFVIGADAPDEVRPGSVWNIGKEGIDTTVTAMPQVGVLPQNSPVPFLEVIDNMVDKISDVTSTPIYLGSAAQSGEALKERQGALVSKARKRQVKIGNKHEDMLKLAAMVTRVYSAARVPDVSRVSAMWGDAQTRSDTEVTQNAKTDFDVTNDVTTYIETVSPVRGWDEAKRQEILARIQQQRRDVLAMAGGGGVQYDFGAVLRPSFDNGADDAVS